MTVPNHTPSESAPPGAATPPAPDWPQRVSATGASFHAWLMRPRVRLTVAGALLLLVGGLIATNSVWTLPLVIVGALMVAVAWIGHRLEGRFAVEWGEAGTRLAFNATIKSPQPKADGAAPASALSGVTAPAARPQLGSTAGDVIEGEAHTVEINVSELKALIAAAEAAEAAEPADAAAGDGPSTAGPAAESPVRDIRIRRLADEGARTPRPAG